MPEDHLPHHFVQEFNESDSNLLIASATWVALSRFDMCKELLEEITRCVVVQISRDMGGAHHYITKRTALRHDARQRDEQIRKEFDGMNRRALSMKFGVSEQTVRNALNVKTVAASENPFHPSVTRCNEAGATEALSALPFWMNPRTASKK